MPRENQKRGRRAKHGGKDSEVVAAPKIKARLPSPVSASASAFGATGESAGEPAPWPLLDPETRAYFEQIEQRILELEGLGIGQTSSADADLDDEDERVLLIRASLSSLSGHEVELATDGEASFILQRLLHSMDDFARRVLADRFTGQFAALAKNRFASHVLQSLFALGANTIDREARGIIAQRPTADGSEDLPTMTTILIGALSELSPDVATLLYDPYASHLLRYALLLVTGQPFPTEGSGGGDNGLRSKKSRKFKQAQAPLKPITVTGDEGKGKERERTVPTEMSEVKGELLEALDVALGKETGGAAARQAASDGVAVGVVQMLLNVEADEGKSGEPGSLLDRLLEGLVTKLVADPHAPVERAGYVDTIMREAVSSHVFETILSRSEQPILHKLWSTYYAGRVAKLAGHPVANFTVAKGVARLAPEQLEAAVAELADAELVATKRLIEGSRTGTLKALLERCAALAVAEAELSELLQQALEITDSTRIRHLVMACLGLSSYTLLAKIGGYLDFSSTPEITLQGSLLAQAWLELASPHSDPILESLIAMPVEYLVTLARHPAASHVLDKALASPNVSGKLRRKLITQLIGHYHVLADDRIGSHVAERCWDAADVYLKEKIVRSLLDHILPLQASRTGHYFARKVQLALYERRPVEWKAKLVAASAAPAPAPAATAEPAPAPVVLPVVESASALTEAKRERKKERKRARATEEADEVDAIFAVVEVKKKRNNA